MELTVQSRGPRFGQIQPPSCFINKTLLTHSRPHLFTTVDGCFRLQWLNWIIGTQSLWPPNVRYLLLALKKKCWLATALEKEQVRNGNNRLREVEVKPMESAKKTAPSSVSVVLYPFVGATLELSFKGFVQGWEGRGVLGFWVEATACGKGTEAPSGPWSGDVESVWQGLGKDPILRVTTCREHTDIHLQGHTVRPGVEIRICILHMRNWRLRKLMKLSKVPQKEAEESGR